jgi:hypothetical protein
MSQPSSADKAENFESKYYGTTDIGEVPVEDTLDLFADVMRDHGDSVSVVVHENLLRDASAEIRRLRRVCEERKAEIQTLQSVIITLQ